MLGHLAADAFGFYHPNSWKHQAFQQEGSIALPAFLVGHTLIWMGLHGYFLCCVICLYRRFKNNIPPTPPPTPPVVKVQEPEPDPEWPQEKEDEEEEEEEMTSEA